MYARGCSARATLCYIFAPYIFVLFALFCTFETKLYSDPEMAKNRIFWNSDFGGGGKIFTKYLLLYQVETAAKRTQQNLIPSLQNLFITSPLDQ